MAGDLKTKIGVLYAWLAKGESTVSCWGGVACQSYLEALERWSIGVVLV